MMTNNSLSVKHQFGTYSRKNEIKRIVFIKPITVYTGIDLKCDDYWE
jgi:hypothetical protein